MQQSFVLTTGVWVALPFFGGLPLILGEPGLGWTDAMFEAVSGMTTTGTTVIEGLDNLPTGANLWRGILQWLGGLGDRHRGDDLSAGDEGRRDAVLPL